jgi:hypothetical protein
MPTPMQKSIHSPTVGGSTPFCLDPDEMAGSI